MRLLVKLRGEETDVWVCPLPSSHSTSKTTYFPLTKENIPDLCLTVYQKLSGLAVSKVTLFISHILLRVRCDPKPSGDGSINYHPGTLTEPKCKQELQSDLGIPGGDKGFRVESVWKKKNPLTRDTRDFSVL